MSTNCCKFRTLTEVHTEPYSSIAPTSDQAARRQVSVKYREWPRCNVNDVTIDLAFFVRTKNQQAGAELVWYFLCEACLDRHAEEIAAKYAHQPMSNPYTPYFVNKTVAQPITYEFELSFDGGLE